MSANLVMPRGWSVIRLSSVADARLGKMLDTEKNKGNFHPYLRNPNIRWFDVDLADLKEMRFEPAEEEKFGIKEGDVLVCEGGEAGRAAIWEGPDMGIKFQKAIHRVRCGNLLYNRFLVHRIMHDYFNGRLAEYYTGATIKHITGQDLARYEFPLPRLDEQRRIAAILDQAQELRRHRKRSVERLDELAQSTFRHFFGDPHTNSRGWPDNIRLGEVAEIVSGVTKGRKLSGESTRVVPYLAVANVQDRFLALDSTKGIEATEAEIHRYILRRDDLLLTEGGDPDKLGRGALWRDELPEAIHQNHIFRVRLNGHEISPVFLNWLVGSTRGKRYFLRSAKQTTGIASINMGQLKHFPLLVPPLEVQQRFAAAVAEIEDQTAMAQRHLRELDALFASLQHRAFSGELTSKAAERELAGAA